MYIRNADGCGASKKMLLRQRAPTHHLIHGCRRADGREGALAADAFPSGHTAGMSPSPVAVLCGSQAEASTQQEVAADGAQESSHQCPLVYNLAAGVDTQSIQRLLTDFAYARDLQDRQQQNGDDTWAVTPTRQCCMCYSMLGN